MADLEGAGKREKEKLREDRARKREPQREPEKADDDREKESRNHRLRHSPEMAESNPISENLPQMSRMIPRILERASFKPNLTLSVANTFDSRVFTDVRPGRSMSCMF